MAGSLPPDRDTALGLLAKARDDAELVTDAHASGRFADAIVGFHAQQAVDKAFKAVLAGQDSEFPYTHDLTSLIEVLDDTTPVEIPDAVRNARWLTPFAVQARYGDLDDVILDRDAAMEAVAAILEWAAALLA